MKSYRNFLIPIIISVFFVFTMAYGIITRFEPVMKIFTTNFLDTTDMPPGGFKDVSQMFNERGFYKSNGFSLDENEIINDFNGNLIYEIPLQSAKLAGGMTLDVRLTYNGSVAHEIILNTNSTYNNNPASRYNINLPEWIVSINGIAVQTFNFETDFYSLCPSCTTAGTISGDDIHPLITGYHINDGLSPLSNPLDRDRV